jgi:CheY-like chemotaxis protein
MPQEHVILNSCRRTNAIKFTKDQPKRWITVKLGGSWTRPPKVWQSVTFSTDDGPKPGDIFERSEWGRGSKGYLWVKVTDTGCGMTAEEKDKLFSRFSQATPRTHVKYGGSGLGLFISKSLATLQGGAIGVFSEAGAGSTFGFYVATRLADAPPASRRASQRPLPDRTLHSEEMMKAAKLNVLIVEDNLVNQKVLKKQLQKLGWTVSVAGNGQEALEWLKGSVYWRGDEQQVAASNTANGSKDNDLKADLDILLMDIEMPIM